MKFALSWLKDYLDTDVALPDLVEAMTMAGLEVEHVEDPRERLAAFTVAKVIKAEPHPDADKLQVCTVETKDGIKQIVCGAPNARTGLVGIFAPLGAYIPGLDFKLDKKPRKIRGVESHGMLCSVKELEAGEDHDGIVDLDGDWNVGDAAADALGVGDPVIDFEVTPNRPDWLGVVGIARDLAAAGVGTFKEPTVEPIAGAFPCPVEVKLEAPEACPVFAGRLIRGVKNGPSPEWAQARLRAIGLRPISALVDVTNLVSYDRARPLHVYDAAKLKGAVRARLGDGEESFRALDEKDYVVGKEMCAIADDSGVIGLGGVMGGESTGCDETTTDVFIECAWFDPMRTARTGRATGILSDAQYRFARGVDPASVTEGIELATRLILEFCGGEPSEVVVTGDIPAPPAAVEFDPGQVKRLTGLETSETEIVAALTALGFRLKKANGGYTVAVPSWRLDVDGPADLVEEVARVVGYDKLPEASLDKPIGRRPIAISPGRKRASVVRHVLAARGLQEAITWSFCRHDQAALFGGAEGLELANPISSELDVMRPTPLVHLLLGLQKNADHGWPDGAFFEVGPVYRGVEPDDQENVGAGVRRPLPPRHWSGGEAPDVFAVKADVLAALDAMGVATDKLQVVAPASPWWHPGRSGRLQLGPKLVLAEFGELHPRVLKTLDVDGPLVGFEVYVDRAPQPRAKATRAKPAFEVLELMPVRRDFAFVVDDSVAAGDVVRAARGSDKALVADVAVFDVFQGEAIGADKKSIAIEVTLQPRDATLDDKALEAVSAKIVAAVTKATGGALRA